MCVQEAEGWHSCCELALQFSVLVLVGVSGVVSRHCLLLCLFFAVVEGTSLLGELKGLVFRTGAGAVGTKKFKLHWVLSHFQSSLCITMYLFIDNSVKSDHHVGPDRHIAIKWCTDIQLLMDWHECFSDIEDRFDWLGDALSCSAISGSKWNNLTADRHKVLYIHSFQTRMTLKMPDFSSSATVKLTAVVFKKYLDNCWIYCCEIWSSPQRINSHDFGDLLNFS